MNRVRNSKYRPSIRAQRSEAGAVLPLISLALAGLVIASLLLGATLSKVVDRADCQHAADASALAGAADGEEEARSLAAANGGRLVGYGSESGQVRVMVSCDGVRAEAVGERELVSQIND